MPSYVLIPLRWLSVAREDAMAAFAKSSRRDCFNTRTLTITVRSGTRWSEGKPDHVEYTAQEIEALVGEFERLEIELFKLRRRIEARQRGTAAPRPAWS